MIDQKFFSQLTASVPASETQCSSDSTLPSYRVIGRHLRFALCVRQLAWSCPWAPVQRSSPKLQLQTFPFSRGQVAWPLSGSEPSWNFLPSLLLTLLQLPRLVLFICKKFFGLGVKCFIVHSVHRKQKKHRVHKWRNRSEKCVDAIRVCFVLKAGDETYFITLKKQKSKDLIVIKGIRGMKGQWTQST